MSWANRLARFGKEIKEETNNIAAKYSPYLTNKVLTFLHDLNRSPFTNSILILDNKESLDFMKKYNGRSYIAINFIEDFFELLKKANEIDIDISFSDSFLKSQKGLIGKARL